jgi:hypothetical protein
MTSALENAVKAGSALMDLEELLRREGMTFTVRMFEDGSCFGDLADGRGWLRHFDGTDTTKVMQKAIKAINARSLHVANSSPVRP